MTMTAAPTRLNDAQFAEIGRRLSLPMTDEGLRAWYRLDVSALLQEVIALRRERAAAMATFAGNPPLEGIDQTADLREVADRLTELWAQHQQGVWQRTEVKRIRDKLSQAQDKIAVCGDRSRRAVELLEQVAGILTE